MKRKEEEEEKEKKNIFGSLFLKCSYRGKNQLRSNGCCRGEQCLTGTSRIRKPRLEASVDKKTSNYRGEKYFNDVFFEMVQTDLSVGLPANKNQREFVKIEISTSWLNIMRLLFRFYPSLV